MICPACHYEDTKVIDSRLVGEGTLVRRRRECPKCNCRFSTIESLQLLNLTVIKRDSRREPYDSNKILEGLKKSFKKRPFDDDDIRRVLFEIEKEIQLKAKRDEINSKQIGEIVMEALKKEDKVAYIRFASVCEGFENIEEFYQAIKQVL
jgi:transcriptional repressor NrdR